MIWSLTIPNVEIVPVSGRLLDLALTVTTCPADYIYYLENNIITMPMMIISIRNSLRAQCV